MAAHEVLAGRTANIAPFHVMSLLARALELETAGRDVVHMEIGEPDFATPEPVIAAAEAALRSGRTRYTPATGIAPLREAIAAHYERRFGVQVDPARIVVTPGGSGALILALAALVDPGTEVLLTDPGYPCNRHLVSTFEGTPLNVPVDADCNYQLTSAAVAERWTPGRTRAVMLASPSNPTGTLLPVEEAERIAACCRDLGGWFILDEIYQGLVYDEAPQTALALSDQIIVINSFSKYFHMTGWRLGWLVVPPSLVDVMERLAQNLFLSASTPAQYAALQALSPTVEEELESHRTELAARRDFLVPAMRELGFSIPVTPGGAFYVYADCSAITSDSFAFATELLETQAVAITPGIDFGTHRADTHVRVAYTTGLARLEEAMSRMRRFIG